MPRSETIAIVECLSRPVFEQNPDRDLFPALAAVKEVLHERQKEDRRA